MDIQQQHIRLLLYYEVLRHYRVVVERGDIRPVVLLGQAMPEFQEDQIFSYRRFLEPALLVPALRPGFEAIEKLWAAEQDPPPPDPPDVGETKLVLFQIQFRIRALATSQGGCVILTAIQLLTFN